MEQRTKKPEGSAFWKRFGQAAVLWGIAALTARVGLPAGTMALPDGNAQLLSVALMVGFVKPAAEELIFRGGAQRLLCHFGGPRIALVGQAVLFAMGHGETPQKLYALAMGLVLGWCAEQTGRVWPGMLLHSINNWIVFAGCLAGRSAG